MGPWTIIDAGPLIAWAVRNDVHHRTVVPILEDGARQFLVPALVITEAAYIIQSRLGPGAEADFIVGLRAFQLEAPSHGDLARMGELMTQYRDFPLGAADASVVALAERLDCDTLLTTDRRHFGVIRPRHVNAFKLLPD